MATHTIVHITGDEPFWNSNFCLEYSTGFENIFFVLNIVSYLFHRCTPELREIVGETREPYRKICSQLEHDLSATVDALQV